MEDQKSKKRKISDTQEQKSKKGEISNTQEPSPDWSSSSSDSAYEDLYHDTVLSAGNLDPNVTEQQIKDFFKPIAEPVDVQFQTVKKKKCATITFSSMENAKDALKKRGESLLGFPMYFTPCSTGLVTYWVGYFDLKLSDDDVMYEIGKIFQSKLRDIERTFVPRIKRVSLGFAYIYLDQGGIDNANISKAIADVARIAHPKVQQ